MLAFGDAVGPLVERVGARRVGTRVCVGTRVGSRVGGNVGGSVRTGGVGDTLSTTKGAGS